MDTFEVESLTSSLVREYLNKRGCKKALKEMDKEFPRPENSINNRLQLIHALSIEPWVRQNKRNGATLKTLIEIIVMNVASYGKSVISDNILHSPKLVNEKRVEAAITSKKNATKKLSHSIEVVVTSNHFKNKSTQQNYSSKSEKNYLKEFPIKDLEIEEVDEVDFADIRPNKMSYERKKEIVADLKPLKYSEINSINDKETKKFKSNIKEFSEDREMQEVLKMLEDESLRKDFKTDEDINLIEEDLPQINPMKSKKMSQIEDIVLLQQQPRCSRVKHLNKFESHETSDETLDSDLAVELRKLIFGTEKRGFTNEWSGQSFTFNECDNNEPELLRIGIHQKKGGPCGLLSVVQAMILKNYIYLDESYDPKTGFQKVTSTKRTSVLEKSLVDIIWKSAVDDKAFLATMTMYKQFTFPPLYRPDGITEYIRLITCNSLKDLQNAVHEHIKEYEKGKGGCILLLYSVILTHGIDKIRSEMDEEGARLLGLHGYCTQEMINLLLQGVATSNAFDNDINLGETTLLRGISKQSEVGLLSLFEHYDSIKIGEYYKNPKYPVWIICSESHFTVLFSILQNSFAYSKMFDLYYYDGLANQDEVIKLTINLHVPCKESDLVGSLVPPLEHCIRTKWHKASIDWNNTDPIL